MVLEPRGQSVRIGDALILECLANANPRPKIQWLHNSILLKSSTRYRFVGFLSSHLQIVDVDLADAGIYTCRVENEHDSVDSSATVVVSAPPKISRVPHASLVQETNDAEFECSAEGVSNPRISWYKNGEIIIPSEYFVVGFFGIL